MPMFMFIDQSTIHTCQSWPKMTGSSWTISNKMLGENRMAKAILRDLLVSMPSIYILLNKFSTVYINR